MTLSNPVYPLFAPLFRYPSEKLGNQARLVLNAIQTSYTEAAESLRKFEEFVHRTPLDTMEEIYTKTFHIQAICYLDLGYVIFGEDYKRGEFLAHMKREQREAGNDCGTDLPDNLSNILTLMPLLADKELIEELSLMIMVPGLRKMLQEFDSAKLRRKTEAIKKKHKALIMEDLPDGNSYQFALAALLSVFELDFKKLLAEKPLPKPPIINPFITSCGGPSIGISR
jgi:nitrate reductase assembly molybdenum cofactor insertion protein NarJ